MQIISIDRIRIDGGTQARAGINEETVAEYAEAIEAGAIMPPVVLYYDGQNYWLADGFHRLHAHLQADCPEVHAEVKSGTQRDAVLHACGANASHGLRRTNADKRRAVEVLLRDGEWSSWSDNQIAKACGVSQPFVSKLRSELSSNGYKIGEHRTVERNGTVYQQNTANIGRKATGEADAEPVPTQPAATPAIAAAEPEQESPSDSDPDLVAELEAASAEITRQEQLIKSLSNSDLAAEVAEWQQRYSQLEGRLRQEMTTSAEAQKQAQYYAGILKKIRQALGVEQTQQILPRLRTLLGEAAA